MGGWRGLIDFAFVACFALAWGVIELRCRQLDRKRAEEVRKTSADASKQ